MPTCNNIMEEGFSIGDGIYEIKQSGKNSFPVYCDMTTDGGGWTNVAYNFGEIIALSNNNGISTSSESTSFLNTPMNSMYKNTCDYSRVNTSFTTDFNETIDFTEVYVDAKSYGSSDIRCGGILSSSTRDEITKFNSFNSGALYRCDNSSWYGGSTPGLGFSEERNSSDLKFKFKPKDDNLVFASTFAACGSGISYMKINKVLVR